MKGCQPWATTVVYTRLGVFHTLLSMREWAYEADMGLMKRVKN